MEVNGHLPVPVAFLQEPTEQEAGWVQVLAWPLWRGLTSLAPTGFEHRFLGIARSLVAILTKLSRFQS